MKYYRLAFFSIIIIAIILIIFGLLDISTTPESDIDFNESTWADRSIVYVNFIPVTSQAYNSGLSIGDTIIAADNIDITSIYQMKRDVFYKKNVNDVIIITVRNFDTIKHIPLILIPRKNSKEVAFIIYIALLNIIVLVFFILTFPGKKKIIFDIFVFYIIVTIAYVYSYVSFERPLLYSILIFTASMASSIPFYMSLKMLLKRTHAFMRLIPLFIAFSIFLFWFFFYIRWATTFNPYYLADLHNVVKLSQLLISLLTLSSIISTSFAIFKRIQGKHETYFPIALMVIFSGFIPYLMLFALPVALGKHEILSVDITLIFTILPLLGLIIYNNFIYEQ